MLRTRILSLLAALLMTLTLSPAALAAESVDLAAVTAENYRAGVYRVSDAEDLENLSRLVAAGVDFAGSRILLTGDIDLTGAYILCEYSDGTTKLTKLYITHLSGRRAMQQVGEHVITVKYFDDNQGYAETTFTVTVNAPAE